MRTARLLLDHVQTAELQRLVWAYPGDLQTLEFESGVDVRVLCRIRHCGTRFTEFGTAIRICEALDMDPYELETAWVRQRDLRGRTRKLSPKC